MFLADEFNVLEAENGLEALKILEDNENIQLVVSDLNMPEMDGMTFIRETRLNDKTKEIPILIHTTETSKDLKKEAKELGVTAWIPKPIRKDALAAIIKKMLALGVMRPA
jgi:two-component system chemotaxis response regulator CheY